MSVTEDARRRHRALADPSRVRILAELAGGTGLDARELAKRVGLHVNTVRVHVNALADAGLVEADTAAPEGRGRPRRTYRATSLAPDDGRRYKLLAEILTALVVRFGPEAAGQLESVGEAWGHYLIDSPPPFASVPDIEATAQVVALLDAFGFQPELETGEGAQRILMRPCPFLELATRHPEVVCPIHLGIVRGAFAQLGASTTATKIEPFVRPDLCVVQLAATPGAARSTATRPS
jgi:predicted ArsR family transcriptional regulator